MVQHSNCAAVYVVFTLFIRPPAGQDSVLQFKKMNIIQGHLEAGNLQRYKQQDSLSPFKTSIYHRKLPASLWSPNMMNYKEDDGDDECID